MKKELCFAETLIVSCCHYDGDIPDNISESSWTCEDSSVETSDLDVKEFKGKDYEVKDKIDEEEIEKEVSSVHSENDFQFYFFPECGKELAAQRSNASVIIVDGLPRLNSAPRLPKECTCEADNRGKCECFTKLPCSCAPKTEPDPECICPELKEVCICHSGEVKTVCTCKESKVCLCHPDNKPRPVCTCDETIPCICHHPINVFPVCTCDDSDNCKCQIMKPKPKCYCLKGKDCDCLQDSCICGLHDSCTCIPEENEQSCLENVNSNSACSCGNIRECNCTKSPDSCQCFPNKDCTCEDPDDCKCFHPCECTKPCLCDVQLNEKKEKICLCKSFHLDNNDGTDKLKKVRVSKEGYRWCHDVDPQHTYFDFAYGRHDKISYKEEPEIKVKILGLHDEKSTNNAEETHDANIPQFKKNVTKSSLDCCSAVGGMYPFIKYATKMIKRKSNIKINFILGLSISIETLGEDKDKFLVQVVGHFSKQGAKTGTKLVSILDSNLHTMEENRIESV